MSYQCDITGKGKQFGHNVSHSQGKTQKVFKPNLQTKTIIINGQKIRLKLATSTIRTFKKYQRELEAHEEKAKEAKRKPAKTSTKSKKIIKPKISKAKKASKK